MARARNIKFGFYENDDLAECSVWARYIYPGLWMLADRQGRLEYRPKKIKGELLRFDSQEAEPLLRELEHHGFIDIYEVDGLTYIQIRTFLKHQKPHPRERASVIPAPPPCPNRQKSQPRYDQGEPRYDPAEPRYDLGQTHEAEPVEYQDVDEGEPRYDPDTTLALTSPADVLNPDVLNPEVNTSSIPSGGVEPFARGIDDGNRHVNPPTPPPAKKIDEDLTPASIAVSLIAWERDRGKPPRGTSASHPHVIDLAAQRVSPAELRQAYDLAVADREAASDPAPINAGFVRVFIDKARAPPRPKTDDWQRTDAGITRKAKEVGVRARPGESYVDLKDRVFEAQRHPRPGAMA
jgi:hypothetical protein